MIFSVIKRFVCVLFSLIIAACSSSATPERRTDPVFSGTFLQPSTAVQWSDERWEDEIEAMKQDGITDLIIQNIADQTSSMSGSGEWSMYYDGDIEGLEDAERYPNVVEPTLEACKGTGIKVWIGLSLFEDFYYLGGLTPQYKNCCKIAAALVEDIYARYGEEYKDTIAGFYFTPEFSNIAWDCLSAKQLSTGLNIVIDKMNEVCPELPILLSPFQTNYVTLGKGDLIALWSNILTYANFRDGDIIAPQDAVGANFSTVDDLETNWKILRELVDSADADIVLWANCESFTLARFQNIFSGIGLPPVTENTMSVPVCMDRFAYQLDIASRYCDKIITFSYNHYLSPNYVMPTFIDAYRYYVENDFTVEKNAPTDPSAFTATAGENGVVLTWNESQDDIGIASYRITKNGEFLTRIECMYEIPEMTFTDENGTASDVYVITACDTSGNFSNAVSSK